MAVVRWFNGRCICLGSMRFCLDGAQAELASVFNNRKTVIEGIEARNEVFKSDFPREYQTWTETAKTTSRVNSMEMWLWMYWNSVPKW